MNEKLKKLGMILFFLLVSAMLVDLAYQGIVLQSIHENTRKMNMNFDGTTAVVVGAILLIANIYFLYLVFGILGRKSDED